jgi:hypothetical protein
MISWLSNATKRRVIAELKDILYEHPRYRSDSNNVQNKFAFDERPQRGVIVNGTSGDRVKLSADNYMGRLSSYCMLSPVSGYPNTTVEWVRENFTVLEGFSVNRDIFPTPPGVYTFEVTRLPDEARNVPGLIEMRPNLTVFNEYILTFPDSGTLKGLLSRTSIYPGSVRLWINNRVALIPDVDFTVDYETSEITFLKSTPTGSVLTADYRYTLPVQGPYEFRKEEFNVSILPGVVIAFGDRCQECDKWDIVITSERTDVADVYGGKFEMQFELIAFSKDSEDREKLSDYLIMKILERQLKLGFEGIELLDVNPGGENEDVFNAETDEYFYESSISLGFRVDWSIYKPLPIVMWRAEMTSKIQEMDRGHLDGSYTYDLLTLDPTKFSMLEVGRNLTYERIR